VDVAIDVGPPARNAAVFVAVVDDAVTTRPSTTTASIGRVCGRPMRSMVVSQTCFESLLNSLQRYHVDNINDAKTDETRDRRIEKAISLFLAKKAR
jgi:hypothetical protein